MCILIQLQSLRAVLINAGSKVETSIMYQQDCIIIKGALNTMSLSVLFGRTLFAPLGDYDNVCFKGNHVNTGYVVLSFIVQTMKL